MEQWSTGVMYSPPPRIGQSVTHVLTRLPQPRFASAWLTAHWQKQRPDTPDRGACGGTTSKYVLPQVSLRTLLSDLPLDITRILL